MSENSVELAKIYYNEFEYCHNLFWTLATKTTLAIIAVIVVPYTLWYDGFSKWLLFIFPLIGGMLCIASAYILWRETRNLRIAKDRYIRTLNLLDKLETRTEYKGKNILFSSKTKQLTVCGTVLHLYGGLLIMCIFEAVLLLCIL